MKYSVYTNRGSEKKTEQEELENFIRYVLDSIEGVDIEEVWPVGEELTPEIKIKLRNFLHKFEIEIIHDGDRGYTIYVGKEDIIAEWKKPRFELKIDNSEPTLSKKIYYKIFFEYWTYLDELEEEE